MRGVVAQVARVVLVCVGLVLVSCGGGGDGGTTSGIAAIPTTGSNVVPVVVDSGPSGDRVNTLYTSVTICVPGSTTQCQTIDHIQVDTGSNGLRLLGSVLTLSLPLRLAADGNTASECTQFVDGISWGPLATADVQLSGETATSVPVQVIGAPGFIAPPAPCSAIGSEEDSVSAFGANGILGVGVFGQDCGSYCASSATSGYYYSCSATACAPIAMPLSGQVLNPVALFVTDNNGSIIDLPAVTHPGATTLTGSLIFGIDTQANNVSGKQTVLTLDANSGNFTTVFAGKTLDQSFIDSGTNGIFFDDANITPCANTNFSGFYCPAASQTLTATLTGSNAVSVDTTFTVDNAQTIATNNPTFTVLPGLGGAYVTDTSADPTGIDDSGASTFDWGLPFYYGRRVATAIELHSTSVGTGPYVAF